MQKPTIFYITYDAVPESKASYTNTERRRKAMEMAGYSVVQIRHSPGRFVSDCITITRNRVRAHAIVIRIDGSGILDKFTVLKVLMPRVPIVWELHGFQQETYDTLVQRPSRLVRIKKFLQRRLLSYLTDTTICISGELEAFAKTQIFMRRCLVIPNFVMPSDYRLPKTTATDPLAVYSNRFLVCWGGSADLPWQAIDVIEQVAKKTYQTDPSIIFLLIGSDAWHTFRWQKNIVCLSRIPRKNFLRIVRQSDVCLALYHKPGWVPFYFAPLKLLDYMALKKPVIATDQPSIRSVITHKINGLLTQNDAAEISKQILYLKHHGAVARRLGLQARQTIMKRYTLKQARDRYARLTRFDTRTPGIPKRDTA